MRDTLLALSGKLDLTMGGPAAVQFNSRGDATFMSGGNPAFLDYDHFDPDSPAACRRAIYRFLFRTVPDPFMDALDCPDGGTSTPVRSVSTTAVQAFAMLNDAFAIRQCEHIAARLAARDAEPEAQAESAFRLILLRAAREPERVVQNAAMRLHDAFRSSGRTRGVNEKGRISRRNVEVQIAAKVWSADRRVREFQ